MSLRFFTGLGCTAVLATILASALATQTYEKSLPVDHQAIRYRQGPWDDPVARLSKPCDSGEVTLDFRLDGFG